MKNSPNEIPPVVESAVERALERQAIDPVLMDVRGLCDYTDFLLILGGRSARQVRSLADDIREGMREKGHRPIGHEGSDDARWVLLDFGDVVIHIFQEDLREYYDLESLWSDAPRRNLSAEPQARTAHSPRS